MTLEQRIFSPLHKNTQRERSLLNWELLVDIKTLQNEILSGISPICKCNEQLKLSLLILHKHAEKIICTTIYPIVTRVLSSTSASCRENIS